MHIHISILYVNVHLSIYYWYFVVCFIFCSFCVIFYFSACLLIPISKLCAFTGQSLCSFAFFWRFECGFWLYLAHKHTDTRTHTIQFTNRIHAVCCARKLQFNHFTHPFLSYLVVKLTHIGNYQFQFIATNQRQLVSNR